MSNLIGKTISHYRIVESLGEGGMGVVYKAVDLRLERTVALKFLPPQTLGSEKEKSRFLKEAQAAAALDHQNICTVHEIDESDGNTFIVMACIDGVHLDERVAAGPLSLEEAIDIATQIAEGLHVAHEAGVVHCDIKPGNVKITPRGQVKIMDFGLARLAGRKVASTAAGCAGTLPYMSPEQTRGGPVDGRTDVWSLGVLLYELVTGQRPFDREYEAAIVYSIVNDAHVPVSDLKPGIPPALQLVIDRALEKDVDKRFSTMEELLTELRQLRAHLTNGSSAVTALERPKILRRLTRRAIVLRVAVIAVLVAVGVYALPFWRQKTIPVTATVLQFDNRTDDPVFDEVLADLLRTDLSRSSHLQVLSKERLQDIAARLGLRSDNDSTGFLISRMAQVQTLISPRIVQIGEMFQVSASIFDVNTEDLLFVGQVQAHGKDSIFVLINELSKRIADELSSLRPSRIVPSGKRDYPSTSSMESFKLYAIGQSHYAAGDPLKAITFLEQSVTLDSAFVEAYRALAISHSATGDLEQAEAYAKRASSLSQRGSATGFIESLIVEYRVKGDWDQAVEQMNRYLEIEPDDVRMHIRLGYVLSRRLGDFDKAIPHFQKAISLDPQNLTGQLGSAYNYLGHAYLYAGRSSEAFEALENYATHSPDIPDPLHSKADALSFTGRYDQALDLYIEVTKKYPAFYESYDDLGLAYLGVGMWRDALSAFRLFVAHAPKSRQAKGHILMGRVYFLQEDRTLVQKEIDEALALETACMQAHWLNGLTLLTLDGDLQGATREREIMEGLAEGLVAAGDMAFYHHLTGKILLANNRTSEGLQALEDATHASPREFMFFRKEFAKGLLEAGRTAETIRETSIVLKLNENDAEALLIRGLAYSERGDREKAFKCFKKAKAILTEADEDYVPLKQLLSAMGSA
jgi:tetratricopeptide (TPR) repeat protein